MSKEEVIELLESLKGDTSGHMQSITKTKMSKSRLPKVDPTKVITLNEGWDSEFSLFGIINSIKKRIFKPKQR